MFKFNSQPHQEAYSLDIGNRVSLPTGPFVVMPPPPVRRVLINACEAGNWTRFINHSCMPNVGPFRSTRNIGDSLVMIVRSRRALVAGEQLFIDYGPGYFHVSFQPWGHHDTFCVSRGTFQVTLTTIANFNNSRTLLAILRGPVAFAGTRTATRKHHKQHISKVFFIIKCWRVDRRGHCRYLYMFSPRHSSHMVARVTCEPERGAISAWASAVDASLLRYGMSVRV